MAGPLQRHDPVPAELLRDREAVDDRVRVPEHAAVERERVVPAARVLKRDVRPELPGDPRAGRWAHRAPVRAAVLAVPWYCVKTRQGRRDSRFAEDLSYAGLSLGWMIKSKRI